ncbi:hypothetical protein [Mesonia aquimarina]|uniref:hypothetical protein n=1 Tax=Mesonia aquimarina TaxID=1504967 RepID=UPI0013CEED3F|nr:hypothetical protein [Mesonia aquimarina]
MSFGGSVHAMITTLKNNARSRSTYFDKEYSSVKSKQAGIPIEKISPEELQKIRIRLQKENKQRTRKRILIFSVIFLLIAALTIFLLEEFI